MDKLRECPLCGERAEVVHTSHCGAPWSGAVLNALGYTVVCTKCGCTIPAFMFEEDVVRRWNERVGKP